MPFDSRGSIKLKPGTVPGLTNKQTKGCSLLIRIYQTNFFRNLETSNNILNLVDNRFGWAHVHF